MHGSVTRLELATDYVMGSLSPGERREVDARRRFDAELDARIEEFEAQLAPLTAAAGEVAPPPGLFDRIMDGIAAQDRAAKAVFRLPFEGGKWEPYSDGIEMKYLWDAETFLLRCQPGAIIPPHGHDLTEHLIVVSGDLLIDDMAFAVGDYHTMPPGTRHDNARTRGGCILFVQSRA